MQRARELLEKTPESFIACDYVFDLSKQKGNFEVMKQNEYYKERWWELEYLDYRDDIEVCIVSCEDAMNLKKNKRIFIDTRELQDYNANNLQKSFHMNGLSF